VLWTAGVEVVRQVGNFALQTRTTVFVCHKNKKNEY
jgi:hypothetical protein